MCLIFCREGDFSSMSIFDSFTKRNSLVKTLRFRLVPMYNSLEQMDKLNVLEADKKRAQYRKTLVEIIGRVDAAFIERVFTDNVDIDWIALAKSLEEDEALARKKSEVEYRKIVSRLLTKDPEFKNILNPTKAVKMATSFVKNEEEKQAIEAFTRFTTVLVEWFNMKKVLFSSEDKRTSIAYRIVNNNFPIYLQNLTLLKKYKEAGLEFNNKLSLEINGYNQCLVQKQIEEYNAAIGHINFELNKLRKQHKLPKDLDKVSLKLRLLQRQIMGGNYSSREGTISSFEELCSTLNNLRETISFLYSELDAIFSNKLQSIYSKEYYSKRNKVLEKAENLIFVEKDNKSITSIKEFLDSALSLRSFIKKLVYKLDKKDNEELTISLSDALDELGKLPEIYKNVYKFIVKKPYNLEKIRCYFNCAAFGKGWDLNKESAYLLNIFKKQDKYYLGIRRLGAVIDFSSLEDKDAPINECYEKMIYKSFDFIKGFPSIVFSKLVLEKFAEGSEEVVFSDNLYNKPFVLTKEEFDQKYFIHDGKAYEKEASDTKFLKDYYTKTGDYEGYLKAVHKRIALAKKFIESYTAFNFFDMSDLKPTEEYTAWSDFINHVNEYTYGINWQKIPEYEIRKLVESGDLFFFQLENKDFALNRKNLTEDEETQLLRQVFSEENKRERIIKLLGDIKIFYRPASLPLNVTHKKGSILVNKKDTNNKPIDSKIYQNIYQYLNKKDVELLPKAKELLDSGLVQWKIADKDIIKDKRFTEDQLFIHFPISINYRSPNRDYDFNKDFRKLIKANDSVNVLGVHLGGENLAEITIIDPAGNVLLEKQYNEFNHYNYSEAISLRYQSMIQAQKNWHQIEKIKNLQKGYMGYLINEISKLILEYNAIVILESYSTVKVKREKQPFSMQFALNLLHKLNYLILKNKETIRPGGILNGYQLCPKVESLSSFANQIGCVFFVLPNKDENKNISYEVALKGSILLKRIKESDTIDKVDLAIKEKQWQKFLLDFSAAK